MQERIITRKEEYVLRLERGGEVFLTLADFCEERGITNGFFCAIGAVERVKLGYYDLAKKEYGSREYPEPHEVASMTGNIALVDGKPLIHCHAVLSGIAPGTENQCVGGHVFEATVAVTLEVHLTAFNEPVTREMDEGIGLKLLNL